jgi:single-strand DNA-binding protein
LFIISKKEERMKNFNLVVMEGRLTDDPELRYTQNGTALCSFSIANNNDYYRQNERQADVCFVDVTVWSKLAQRCGEYLKKGRRVLLAGRLKQDRWQDKDGKQHSKLCIVCHGVRFLDRYNEEEENQEEAQEEVQTAAAQ